MSSSKSRAFVDRDDFDPDHYADCIRDLHRSRITLDQLDIARRQLRKKESLLSRTHELKMKEHFRVKNEFIRKVEKDARLSKLPTVKQTLKTQQRRYQSPSPPLPAIPIDDLEPAANDTQEEQKPLRSAQKSKPLVEPHSSQKQRLKSNIAKFNHQNLLLV